MADDPVLIRDANRATVPILLDTVTQRNGVETAAGDRVQILRIAHGTDGQATDVNPASPLPTRDFTPTLSFLTDQVVELEAGVAQTLTRTAGAMKVDITHSTDGAVVRVRPGGVEATATAGYPVSAGGFYGEYIGETPLSLWCDIDATVYVVEYAI